MIQITTLLAGFAASLLAGDRIEFWRLIVICLVVYTGGFIAGVSIEARR